MLWLNAGIQKKKDIKLKSDSDENITRIRQLWLQPGLKI